MSEVRIITEVSGRAVPLAGDDIDTDRIIPARFLRTVTFDGLEAHVFEDDRKAAAHPFDDPRFHGAAVLVVNSNFGCGSSREHAPQALYRWGIRAVVGESFSDIFFGNAVMIGLPCLTATGDDVRALMAAVEAAPQTEVAVSLAEGTCTFGKRTVPAVLPPNVRDAFATGAWDTTGLLRERFAEVDAVADRLPYVSGFASATRA
jgi:3-isopropylmalate/(R)-2-methylmalate dehydratase small subunit